MTAIALLGLWSGVTLVVVPKFELEAYLDLVERYRPTLLHVVPPVVVALAKHPSVAGRDFSSIRKLFSGAAPLGADVTLHEAVLLSHPAVADAAVVPLQNAECGEIPRAFVVLKGSATADELMTYVAERVASYKKVRRLEFIDAIPKAASGKILRRLLKDLPLATEETGL